MFIVRRQFTENSIEDAKIFEVIHFKSENDNVKEIHT